MIVWLASYPRSGNTLLREILKKNVTSLYFDDSFIVKTPIEEVRHRLLLSRVLVNALFTRNLAFLTRKRSFQSPR